MRCFRASILDPNVFAKALANRNWEDESFSSGVTIHA